jgi:hypothetical protein
MAAPNTVAIISGGTTYNFWNASGTRTPYAGSGTPWTSAATSPYTLSNNDATPDWVPGPAPASIIATGGPPFSLGSRPLYVGYDTIQESVGVQLYATTKDNAIALLNQLRQILNTTLFSTPALLSVKGGTNTGYAEILWADVSELNTYIEEVDGRVFRATITWRRAPFFSAGSLTTLINGLTYTNAGSSNNTRSLGAITGDLLYEGSPLNILIAPASGFRYLYAATVYQRIYNAGIAATTTTSSTSGTAAFNDSTAGITSPARTRYGLRLRVMLRTTSISAKAQVQIFLVSSTSSRTLWKGPWVSAGAIGQTLIDATPSGVPLDLIRRSELGGSDVNVGCLVRSTDGSSVSLNLHSAEYLLYYTFCRIDTTTVLLGANDEALQIEQAHNLGGQYVPSWQPGAYAMDTTGTDVLADIVDMRGTLPRAISGASLYLTWMGTSFAFDSTDSAVVTAKHLPLYRTLRGNG